MKKKHLLLIVFLILFIGCEKEETTDSDLVTANFTSNKTTMAASSLVQYSDLSSGEQTKPSRWEWHFPGGTPEVSLEKNPLIRYDFPGVFDVQLIVSNGFHYDTLIRNNFITVSESSQPESPLFNLVYGVDSGSHILDLYYPSSITDEMPLIILLGGGDFFIYPSNRNLLVSFASELNKHGYAVATARYRTVEGPATSESFQEGLIKSQQDSKAAVRFFKANGSLYKIDTSRIIIGGYSNGAVAALNHAYWDLEEMAIGANFELDRWGGLEGNQGNNEYSSEVSGVISLAGELVASLGFISEDDPAFFGVCAADDQVFSCYTRRTAGGFPTYGTIPIDSTCRTISLKSDYFIIDKGGHFSTVDSPERYIERLLSWLSSIENSDN